MQPATRSMTQSAHPAWDGIVFDLDGTLWDATATVARAWDAVARQWIPGHPGVIRADIRGVMGLAHAEIARRIFPQLDPAQREAVVQACYTAEAELLRREGAMVYAGVRDGLAALAVRYPLAIVSNCQRGYIETFFAVTGLERLFCDAECHGNTGLSKGENLMTLAGRCGMARAVFVGNTAGDEAAAEQAGVLFIHVRYGFGQPLGACPAVADFAELTRVLLEAGPQQGAACNGKEPR